MRSGPWALGQRALGPRFWLLGHGARAQGSGHWPGAQAGVCRRAREEMSTRSPPSPKLSHRARGGGVGGFARLKMIERDGLPPQKNPASSELFRSIEKGGRGARRRFAFSSFLLLFLFFATLKMPGAGVGVSPRALIARLQFSGAAVTPPKIDYPRNWARLRSKSSAANIIVSNVYYL